MNKMDETKNYYARRIYDKMEIGVEVIGVVSSLLIKSTLLAYIKLGVEFFKKTIPNEDIEAFLEKVNIFKNAKKMVTDMRDNTLGNMFTESELESFNALSKIHLMSDNEISKLRRYEYNVMKTMVLENEASFKGYDSKVLWMNVKPETGEFNILVIDF